MAGATVLLNCKIHVGRIDLSGDSNSVNLAYGAEMLDDTVFRPTAQSTTRSFKPGLKTVTLSGSLFWNNDGKIDRAQFEQIGAENQVMSVAQVGELEGDIVHFTKGVRSSYNPASGEVGAILTANLEAQASNAPLVRGRLLTSGQKTAPGSSVGLMMGSAAGKMIYSALHVESPSVAGAGGELFTGTIESSADSGFSAPTVRLTHPNFAAWGSDWQQVRIPPLTADTWWRATWVVAGAAPDFTVYWSFGMIPE